MNELNLAIYTGKDQSNSVTLTAKFSTHEEAVKFHAAVAEICRGTVPKNSIPWNLNRAMLAIGSQRG